MNIHMSRRLFLPAAVLGGVAVFAAVFFVALAVHSVIADPAGPVPDPGHAWTDIQGHGDDADACYVSTQSDQAFEVRVNGDRALRLEPDATSPNVIGGHSGNSVDSGVYGATIGGGGESSYVNRVTDEHGTVGGGGNNQAGNANPDSGDATYATVAGGEGNTASAAWATVGGGHGNTADDWRATVAGGENNNASNNMATVGGGYMNVASGSSATVAGGEENSASGGTATVAGGYMNRVTDDFGTVAGGRNNLAGDDAGTTEDAPHATVGGGWNNTASGRGATVPGGESNTAAGDHSFAAGHLAKVNAAHEGTFLFADQSNFDFDSAAADEFAVRATGGFRFISGINGTGTPTSWCNLPAGTGAWSCSSDRDIKENFTPVDGQEVLASLAEIPIATWNYKAQEPSIQHMGPVAQDFYAAFGLGESDTSISTVDTDGVALAAIQGLYELSQEQAERIDALEARVAALEGEASGGSAGPLASIMPFGPLLLAGLFVGGLVVVQRRRAGGRR